MRRPRLCALRPAEAKPVPDLHGIGNPINFARRALNDELDRRSAFLDPARYDDALSYLVEALYVFALRFDPARGLSFSTYAYPLLRKRYTSWLRKSRGDSSRGTWIGGDAACRHTPVPEQTPRGCACGAQWLGNERRELLVGDPFADDEAFATEDVAGFDELFNDLEKGLTPRSRDALQLARRVAEERISLSQAAADVGKGRKEAAADRRHLADELRARGDLVA